MEMIPRFRSFFYGQTINSIGIPFLFSVAFLICLPQSLGFVLAVFSTLFLASFFKWKSKTRAVFLQASAGVALALVVLGAQQVKEQKLCRYDGKTCETVGVITYVSEGEYDLSVTSPFRGKVRVAENTDFSPGSRISQTIYLSADVSVSQRSLGIDFTGAASEDGRLVGKHVGYAFLGTVRQTLSDSFGEDRAGGFFRAILLGDRTFLDQEDREAFKKTASSHLIAISGLHVSQLLGNLFFFASFFGMGRKGKALVFLPVLFLLFLITGFSVSVFRAVLMAAFPLVGNLARRESDSVTALIFAASLLIVWEPYVVLSASFLLSFASTFGILVAALPLMEGIRRFTLDRRISVKDWRFPLIQSFLISSAAFVFTAPFLLLIFDEVFPFAPLYSVFLSPLFALVLSVGIFTAPFAKLPGLGTFLIGVGEKIGLLFLSLNRFLSLGATITVSTGAFSMPLAFFFFGILLFCLIARLKVTSLFWIHGIMIAVFCLLPFLL